MRKRLLASAKLKGRTLLLEAKSEVISNVFKMCEDRLRKIADGMDTEYKYEELLLKLLVEAAHRLEERELIATSNQKTLTYLHENTKKIEETLRKNLGFEVELKIENSAYDCIGGLVILNPDRTKMFYNTLDGRLLTMKNILTGRVAEILFA